MSSFSSISKQKTCLWVCLLLGTRSLPAQSEAVPAEPLQIEVLAIEVNELPVSPRLWNPLPATSPLIFPSVRSLRVRFQDRTSDTLPSRKLRYFLAGQDTEWHSLRAHAQLTVRFLDDDGAIIGSQDFNAEGESPGWTGTVYASQFTPRSAELIAPARSNRIQLTLISSIPEMLGQYAVRDISLMVYPQNGTVAPPVSLSTEDGVEMDKLLGSPLQWARSGTRAQLAQVLALHDGKHALALVDNAAKAFGAWILKPSFCPRVKEGDRIVLNWSECFSLGRGHEGSAIYGNLPSGNYRLLVAGRDLDGRDTAGITILSFRVPLPYWERSSFWVLVCMVAAGAVFAITRYSAKRRMQLRLAAMERVHLLERERSRIARDIHDELGASLAAIALMSGRTRDQLPDHPEAAAQVEEISRRATKTARQLAEIVWAVNPARDSIEHLVEFICQSAQEYLELAKVRFRTEIPAELPALALSASARHTVFLAAKELIHNAVRHGHPTVIFLRVACAPDWLFLEFEDNGCGFALPGAGATRGLSNVTERMKQVGGEFHLHSAPGQGTRVKLCVPLPQQNATS